MDRKCSGFNKLHELKGYSLTLIQREEISPDRAIENA